ncbi:extracellular solute-binding protein [Dactylosporangium sp. AC04546]|uniref:ABC transporter substrate-binding protein n=1 Tax=Dactylosporangium sp. AC04546 TaxID=2862460 RepID=UPI001EDD225D|nr:extracellular solute-binding protein [Dactylosporangium sp. AC04546]WVK81502.1 extracellular solute-binding protein [Dactylosporangium sp. AC04546]
MRGSARLRRGIAGILTITAVGLAAACGSSGPGTGKDGAGVQVWALQDAAVNPIATASIDAFNKASGNKVELVTYVNDAYKQKLQVAMGSPQAPDVFFNWGGGNLAEFVKAGQVEPLDDLLVKNPQLKEKFLPSVMDVGKVDGKQYGLPMLGVLPVVLFYNKDVFAAAGAQPPKTYADLLALVDTFKAKGVTPIALAGSQGWTELMWLEYLLDRIGGADKFQAIAAGKPGAWADPAVVKALTEIQALAKKGAFGSNFASVNYDNQGASKLLATGKAAMHLMGTWDFSVQKEANAAFITEGKLGYVAFPAYAGGAGDPKAIVGNPSNYYSVNAASKNKTVAADFLAQSLVSDAYISGLIDAGQVPAVKGAGDILKSKPNAEFTGFTYDLVAGAPTFTQSWDQALSPSVSAELLTNLQKLFLGDITPDAFAAAMAKAK